MSIGESRVYQQVMYNVQTVKNQGYTAHTVEGNTCCSASCARRHQALPLAPCSTTKGARLLVVAADLILYNLQYCMLDKVPRVYHTARPLWSCESVGTKSTRGQAHKVRHKETAAEPRHNTQQTPRHDSHPCNRYCTALVTPAVRTRQDAAPIRYTMWAHSILYPPHPSDTRQR